MVKKINTQDLGTGQTITWCPGCPNHGILESVKRTISEIINNSNGKLSQKDFAITTGIGCSGKIFDYLNINGFYGLHGRPIPTAMGIKLANPNLNVLAFAGDGDTYSEGMAHFIHAFRYNPDMTLVVHDNQSFSLTTGQSTPVSQQGFKNKANPLGEYNQPFNPIKIALSAGATFIARCNALDVNHTVETLKKAINHKGFAYVEIMQKCLIFNKDMNDIDNLMYKIKDNKELNKAYELANEWDYNSKKGKIPLGIIYQTKGNSLDDKLDKIRKK